MEGERKGSERGSAGDGFKLPVSQADMGSSALPGCHLHRTQYPLYSQYHLSLFRFILLPGVATPGVMHFFSHHHTAASETVYIIPSHCRSHSRKKKHTGKKTHSYLTYTCSLAHTLSLPTVFLTSSLCFFFLHTLGLCVSLHTILMSFTPGSPYITILSAVLL